MSFRQGERRSRIFASDAAPVCTLRRSMRYLARETMDYLMTQIYKYYTSIFSYIFYSLSLSLYLAFSLCLLFL